LFIHISFFKQNKIKKNRAHTNENPTAIFTKKVQLTEQLKQLGRKVHTEKQTDLPEIDSEYVGFFIICRNT